MGKTREEGKQRLVNMKQRMLQRIPPFIHSTLPRQKNESAFSFSLFFGQNKISYFTLSFTTHCVVKKLTFTITRESHVLVKFKYFYTAE